MTKILVNSSGKAYTSGGNALALPTGVVVWGDIGGTLSNQTDLQTALNGKSNTNHTHSGVYEPSDSTILKEADIINNLISTSTTNPLSANQGKVLNDNKVDKVSGKELSENDLTDALKSQYDAAVTASHGINDVNSSHYTKTDSDAKYVNLSSDQSINGSKTFNNARAENIPDINDADPNKFATLDNVKNTSGGVVKFLITDTNLS